jgi:hypothetical protein
VKQYGPRRSQSAAGTPTTSFYSRSEASPKGNVSGKKHGSASSDPTPKGMPIEDRRFIGQSQVCRSWDEAFHKRRLHGFSPTIETTGEIMGKAEMFVHPRMAPAPPAGIPPFMRPLPGHKLYNDMASKAPRSPFPDIVTDEIKWQHAQLSGKKPHAGTFRSTSKASSKAKSEPAGSIHSAKSARDGRDGSDLAWLSRTSDSAKQSLSQISKDLLDKLRVSRDEDDEESLVCADARRVESGELERGPGQMFPAQTRAE